MSISAPPVPRRVDPCPCGSGKRYKHCHGAYPGLLPFSPDIELIKQRLEADRARRNDFQGKGKQFISATMQNGLRIVAVRNKLMYGRWKTVTDFLMNYIAMLLGGEWGNAEIAKPVEERHPLLNMYQMVCKLQAEQTVLEDGLFQMPVTGAVSSYFGLAYNLYCIDHNAQVHDRLLQRLKNKDLYEDTRYEVLIAGAFTRAGFELAYEDEDDGATTHHEFVATNIRTRRSFSVECKRKNTNNPKDFTRIGRLMRRALCKHAEHERIIFLDLNYPEVIASVDEFPAWMEHAVNQVHKFEATQKDVDCLPSATVILTNNPSDIFPDEVKHGLAAVRTGFKKPDMRHGRAMTLRAMIIAREKNAEIYELLHSLEQHSNIPSTFDGSILELSGESESTRLLIGNRYVIDEGRIGLLIEAIVMEQSKCASCIMKLEDGTHHIVSYSLSENEMAAYRSHPATFFGVLQASNEPLRDPLDYYDFHLRTLATASKQQLLDQMTGWPAAIDLASRTKGQLASLLAETRAEQMLAQTGQFNRPDNQIRSNVRTKGHKPDHRR